STCALVFWSGSCTLKLGRRTSAKLTGEGWSRDDSHTAACCADPDCARDRPSAADILCAAVSGPLHDRKSPWLPAPAGLRQCRGLGGLSQGRLGKGTSPLSFRDGGGTTPPS